jgi:hypothetical protein
VHLGTGIDSDVLLAQWGVETIWGSAINKANNLANTRCSPTTFCQYATLDDWDSSHYNNGGGPGSSLLAALKEIVMTQAEFDSLVANNPLLANLRGGLASTFNELTNVIKPKRDAIKAALAAIQPGGGLTPAQAQQLTNAMTAAQTALARLEAAGTALKP